MLTHRESITMRLNEFGDVVADHAERQGKRAQRRVDGGKPRAVAVHLGEFVVPGHRDDTAAGYGRNRALCTQVLVVRVRIRDQSGVAEEVDLVVVRWCGRHAATLTSLTNTVKDVNDRSSRRR